MPAGTWHLYHPPETREQRLLDIYITIRHKDNVNNIEQFLVMCIFITFYFKRGANGMPFGIYLSIKENKSQTYFAIL